MSVNADVRAFKDFEPPGAGSARVWRYMPVERFESLLQEGALYFASARQFTDQYEGAISRLDQERRTAVAARFGWNNNGGAAFEELRRLTKVSCWHMSDYESEAMWRLYVSQGKGVAVQSTIQRLASSLLPFRLEPSYGEETIWIGSVRYLDYRTEAIPDSLMLGRFFCKRRSYVHEAEVRAVLSLRQAEEFGVSVPEHGIKVSVDLGTLIERVFVAPGVSDSFREQIANTLKTARIASPVERTELDDPVNY